MQKLTFIILLITNVLIFGCDNKKKKKSSDSQAVTEAKANEEQIAMASALFKEVKGDNASAKLEILPFDKNKVPRVTKKYKGKLVAGGHWRDKGGEQWLLLTETGDIVEKKAKTDTSGHLVDEPGVSAEAHAYFWVKKHGSFVAYRHDMWIEKCGPFDVLAQHLKEGFSITDVNKNGVAEVTLSYRHACRSDVSPADLTLRMIEKDKIYEMHGTSKLRMGTSDDAYVMKSTRKEGTFANAPAAFKAHINGIWEKVKEEKLK